jgi:hypothetical protein
MSAAVPLAADELSIVIAPRVDFSLFRTFAFREQTIESERPELDNRLFGKTLATTIRAALIARGLAEATTTPDLLVDVTLTGEEFARGEPTPARGVGPRPVRSTQGTLVIDLVRPGEPAPVWRGIYRDEEPNGSRLVRTLPQNARKLIDRYPRRSR